MEHDHSDDLRVFRKGPYLVLQTTGMTKVAERTKIPHTTLYRMLRREGNPNLRYPLRVLHYLQLRPWVVSEEFLYSAKTKRFRDEEQALLWTDSPFYVIGAQKLFSHLLQVYLSRKSSV